MTPNVIFVKKDPSARIPSRGSDGAAGYDLSSCVNCIVPAKSQTMVSTGLSLQMNMEDCYARVAPRSGLAAKNSIDVLAGVVDYDYKGVIQVILYNHGDKDVEIHVGDRIAQLIFERIYLPSITEGTLEDLEATTRGDGGFGSTGRN